MTAPTCAEVAPVIIHSALGPSPLGKNIRYLMGGPSGRASRPKTRRAAIQWAVEAFRKAGVEEVHVETYAATGRLASRGRFGRALPAEDVVAEIRGREKPGEFVILGAHWDASKFRTDGLDDACNAALVIDAARAIHSAGTHPLRSIRFVLFAGESRQSTGSWGYARAHRAEMDRADAAILYEAATRLVDGYDLEGRPSLETPLRKALEPAGQFHADHDTYGGEMGNDSLDFLLEGVPTLVAGEPAGSHAPGKLDLANLKRNVALAAVTAYGIADLPGRMGARQTRPQIEGLLKRTGLEKQMKSSALWSQWERGERGRKR